MYPGARHDSPRQTRPVISVHFVVVTKSIVETAMDDLFPCEPTLQLFLETFRLLNEQDTTMTLEFVLQLCDD